MTGYFAEIFLVLLLTAVPVLNTPFLDAVDLRGQVIKVLKPTKRDASTVVGVLLVDGVTPDAQKMKAVVRVNKTTRLVKREKGQIREVSFKSLKAGLNVEIRFSGPLKESYPVQAIAAEVLIFE